MLRIVLVSIAAYCATSLAAAQDFPCVAARNSPGMITAFPGYDNDADATQPAFHKALQQCLTKYEVCLLLDSHKVVKAHRLSDVKIHSSSIIFGLVQTHRGKSRNYCTIGSLLSSEEGPFWSYLTFAPNGDGGITEGLIEDSGDPKTSAELFSMLDKNFRHSIRMLRRGVSSKEIDLKSLGYRDGEEP